MGTSQHFVKDPEAVLDYSIDWTNWLGSDTISMSTWTVPTGLTKKNDTKTTVKTTIWLSGGVGGTEYAVVNHIKTAAGREDDRTLYIHVENR